MGVDPVFDDICGGLTTGGSANAYTLITNQSFTAYYQGFWVKVKVHASNTTASTLNVNGIGAASIKNALGNDLASGQLTAGGICDFVYNGSNFIAINSALINVDASGNAVIAGSLSAASGSFTGAVAAASANISGAASAASVSASSASFSGSVVAGSFSGPVASLSLLTGSRVFNTKYQNTSTKTMLVTASAYLTAST